MELAKLIARRAVQLLIVLLFVSLFTFFLVRLLPGDPTDTIIPFGTEEKKAQLRSDLGLGKPLFEQYTDYLGNIIHGDLGRQYSSGRPVSELVAQSLPVSIQLMIYAQLIALLVAIPLGIWAAYRAGSRSDSAINTTGFALLALPNFVVALVLSYLIGAKWKLLPTGGYAPGWLDPLFDDTRSTNIGEHFNYMLLPAITLALGQIAIYMRLLRSDMIATLKENFISMARSKGISNRRILWRHALRPSSLTLLTVVGLNVGALIGGAIVVEVIFSIPGMGLKITTSIFSREYIELQGYVLVVAVLFILINFFVDFLYTILDPRIRRGRSTT